MKKENEEKLSEVKMENKPAKSDNKKWLVAGGVAVVFVGALIASQLCCKDKKISELSQQKTDNSAVVALIGGNQVKMSDLEAVKNSVPQLKEMPMEIVYNKLLEAYVNNQVILDAAKKADIQNRADVKKMISDAQDQILFQAYLSEQLQSRMTPDELQAIYNEEIKNFTPQDEIHARHILVATEKEAKDLIVQLKGGADFETLANQHSLDKNPGVDNGGDLGYFTKDMMIPDFGNAAFAIKVGQISEKPIKTPFGWHVVKVEDKRKAAPPTIAQMGEVIKAKFTEKTVPLILEAERTKAGVKLFDPLGVNKVENLPIDIPAKASTETTEPAAPKAE